jgi:hypothetical protein
VVGGSTVKKDNSKSFPLFYANTLFPLFLLKLKPISLSLFCNLHSPSPFNMKNLCEDIYVSCSASLVQLLLVFVFGVVRLLSSWAVYKGVSLVLFVFIFPCPVYVILSWMCLIVAADVFLWKCRNCRLGFFLAAWISLSYSHLCHFNCGSSLIVFLVIKGCDKEG